MSTLAAKIGPSVNYDYEGKVSTDRLPRVLFYTLSIENENYTVKYINSTRCNEKYSEDMEFDHYLEHNFVDDSWICPDVDSFEVHSYPDLITATDGTALHMVVQSCKET